MKNFLSLALLLLVACEPLSPSLHTGRSRNVLLQWYHPDREAHGAQADTAIWLTGVEFPDGYDWRMDSLRGSISATLVLLRDGERVLEVPAGRGTHAGADPDRHILLEGHLYSYCTTDGATWLLRDGEEVCHTDGSMLLRGLLESGRRTVSLWQELDGAGMCAMEDDRKVWESREGRCAEGLHDTPLRPTGALHEDGGHIYFYYAKPLNSSGSQSSWYMVKDWHEEVLQPLTEALRILDARHIEDMTHMAWIDSQGMLCLGSGAERHSLGSGTGCSWCRVMRTGGNPGCVFRRLSGASVTTYVWHAGQFEGAWDGQPEVYPGEGGMMVAKADEDGGLTVGMYGSLARKLDDTFYFFSWRNATLAHGEMLLALTPRREGTRPILYRDGAGAEVPLKGFLTGVYVTP